VKKHRLVFCLGFSLLLIEGCTGKESQNSGQPNGGSGGEASSGAEGGSSGGEAGGGKSQSGAGGTSSLGPLGCGPLGASPLRRLAHVEYGATVASLFPKTYPWDSGGKMPRYDKLPPAFRDNHLVPDPDEMGFGNRADRMNPTELLVSNYDEAASIVAADVVSKKLDNLVSCTEQTAACGRSFVKEFGARAFRRPLEKDEEDSFAAFFEQELKVGDFSIAVELTLQAFLQSPQFLYRIERGVEEKAGLSKLSSYEVASRMSYLLWSTMPDAVLLEAASKGQLDTAAGREEQARRMLKDPRATFMFVEFHRQWLGYEDIWREVFRDPARFPEFQHELRMDLRQEMQLFAEWIATEGGASVKSLLTSNVSFVTDRLATFYGVPKPASPWDKTMLKPLERAGTLTRGHFNLSHARPFATSPPLRGVFIYRRLLCQDVPPPPANVVVEAPSAFDTSNTNRKKFEAKTAAEPCKSCHATFDPFGYSLENYDAIGKYKTMDSGRVIDASVTVSGLEDLDGNYKDMVALSKKMGESAFVASCALSRWYEYAEGRRATEEDDCRIEAMSKAVAASNGNIYEALVARIKMPDFAYRPVAANP
jgi:hypothetical protein